MSPEDRAIIEEIAEYTKARLEKHYAPGFGVFPTSDPDDNYYNQVWARDFAHAAGNYFIVENPQAVYDSLQTLFKYQQTSGALPYRVEREYTFMRVFPGLNTFSRPLFKFIEGTFFRRNEKPKYEGAGRFAAGDTVPVALITCGDFFEKEDLGKRFVRDHYADIIRAADYFAGRCDPQDGLAVIKGPYPDWIDTVRQEGKLGLINIFWARALERVAFIARATDHPQDAARYLALLAKVRQNIIYKLYNSEKAYFRTRVGGFSRTSTTASIFGSYILSPREAVRIQETLNARARRPNGYVNFYPPYPSVRISRMVRYLGHADYHNRNVWPWVTLQNIHVKIRIAQEHIDSRLQEQYKQEAINDFLMIAKLFKTAGGAYEMFNAEKPIPGRWRVYKSARHFMASMAGYQSVYRKLTKLGWLS